LRHESSHLHALRPTRGASTGGGRATHAAQEPDLHSNLRDGRDGERLHHDRRKWTEEFVHSKYLFRKPQPEEYLQRLTQALLHTPTNLAIAIWVGYFTSDYRRALARIDKPALIIVAAQGLCGSGDAVCEDMQRRIRDSRLEVLENVDHALFVDDPNGSIRCSRVS